MFRYSQALNVQLVWKAESQPYVHLILNKYVAGTSWCITENNDKFNNRLHSFELRSSFTIMNFIFRIDLARMKAMHNIIAMWRVG